MALALNGMSLSKVTLSFGGVVGMRVTTEGVTTLRYQRQRERGADKLGYPKCDSYWLDLTYNLFMAIRDVAFRAAVQWEVEGEAAAVQEMLVDWETTAVVYQSDYRFLGMALGLVGLSVLTVAPLLLGWWRLGRDVSLLPVEVARAFGAAELAGSGSNSTAGELMKEIGSKEVRYGKVVGKFGAATLGFAHPKVVHPPRKGVVYS